MIIKQKDYDIFIAYHGTYENGGSKPVADSLYEYMTDKGLKVFYFPKSNRDTYKANIIDVLRARTFILVSNERLNILDNNKIDNKYHYELSCEIDAFYALTQMGEGVSVQDSKVLVCGDYMINRKKGQETEFHELFANRTHYYFDENNCNSTFDEIYIWLKSRLESQMVFHDSWQDSVTTNEVREVFTRRSSMNQKCNLSKMVASAQKICGIGISNTELTVKIDQEALKYALRHGAMVELIFLDPEGIYTAQREKEEGLRPDRIKNITLNNMTTAFDLKDKLDEEMRMRFRLYKYNELPRMNIIIIDHCILLQYYANTVAGMSNPCFLIEKQPNSPLYDFCVATYEELKKGAIEIE